MKTELSSIIPDGAAGESSNNNNDNVEAKYPSNQLIFVGKGNPVPSKYIIVSILFYC